MWQLHTNSSVWHLPNMITMTMTIVKVVVKRGSKYTNKINCLDKYISNWANFVELIDFDIFSVFRLKHKSILVLFFLEISGDKHHDYWCPKSCWYDKIDKKVSIVKET